MPRRMLLWMILLMTVVACAMPGGNTLANTQWQLLSMNDQTPPDGIIVNLAFTQDTFGGVGFCNNYGGNYRVSGDTLTMDQMTMTMMACIGDNRDQLEQQYVTVLQQVTTYARDENELRLLDGANRVVLRFVPLN
ncbi:MAG: META domain-containing protein [Chloroflexi bacterium]|nr:META domain-containing protein [Chloroflexota bacterium]